VKWESWNINRLPTETRRVSAAKLIAAARRTAKWIESANRSKPKT
jgi:hypothetical protein